jgi:hypothetical protein
MDDTDDNQTNALVVSVLDHLSAPQVMARERQDYQRLLLAIQDLSEAELTETWSPGGRSILAILPG